METPFLQLGIFYVLLVATAGARMVQGVCHHKPVTFLFIETVVLLVGFYAIIKRASNIQIVIFYLWMIIGNPRFLVQKIAKFKYDMLGNPLYFNLINLVTILKCPFHYLNLASLLMHIIRH